MIVIAIIGVLASLAIYGVRSYLAVARTAEAKANIGAVSQLAAGAFEREYGESELIAAKLGAASKPAVNYLCGSANPVPTNIAKGTKYQPSNAPGSDFHSGTSIDGWVCIGYTMSTPIYYRYTYQKADGYVSPPLGGPDPGPEGFEAAAQGDLDGDNTLSTFARSGTIVNKGLVLSTHVFVADEFE
jgi:type IV pilus assembly protein PilA